MLNLLQHVILTESNINIVLYYFISTIRHTDEMIKKLESAGLGFYVKATETQQKLGNR